MRERKIEQSKEEENQEINHLTKLAMSQLEEQISEQIASVEESLTNVDEVFGNLNTLEYDDIVKKMSPLDRAKYDLTNLYAINSLFWMYTKSFGEDPKTLPIKEELDRIKQQMMRVKEIGDKSKMPRVDKEVAQRMIRHELWDPKKSNRQQGVSKDENWEIEEPMETDNKIRAQKRKFPTTSRTTDENGEDSKTSSTPEGPEDEDQDEVDEPSLPLTSDSDGEEDEQE